MQNGDIQLFAALQLLSAAQGRERFSHRVRSSCALLARDVCHGVDSEVGRVVRWSEPREPRASDHQTVGMMMADVFEVMMVFGFVEPLVSISQRLLAMWK